MILIGAMKEKAILITNSWFEVGEGEFLTNLPMNITVLKILLIAGRLQSSAFGRLIDSKNTIPTM